MLGEYIYVCVTYEFIISVVSDLDILTRNLQFLNLMKYLFLSACVLKLIK